MMINIRVRELNDQLNACMSGMNPDGAEEVQRRLKALAEERSYISPKVKPLSETDKRSKDAEFLRDMMEFFGG